MERIAVLGGGAGGLSCVAELCTLGYSVNLFELTQFKSPHIDAIHKRGGIEARGIIEGLITPNLVTSDIGQAVRGVDVVLIIAPSYAVEVICKLCLPTLEDDQVVIFHGKGGHSLEFESIMNKLGMRKTVTLGETHTLPWSARITGEGQVTVFMRNRILVSSALPSKNGSRIAAVLRELYPPSPPHSFRIIPGENVLTTTLCDINSMHPIYVIFNLSRVESEKKDFRMYVESRASASIAKILNVLEKERLAVMRGFALKPIPRDVLFYPDNKLTKIEKEWRTQFYEYVMVSSTKDRYLSEDVPYGLVTIASLAHMIGVKVPLTKAIIHVASAINGIDYWKEGRTLEKLGISDLNVPQLHEFLENESQRLT